MATSEEVFELIEQTSARLRQFKTVLSLAHDASDAGLTPEEVILRDRITEAQNHFHAEPPRANRSPLKRFLHRADHVEDLTKLESELDNVQARRSQSFDIHVFEEPEVEQMSARRASHAARPYIVRSFENRKHYADHLNDGRRMFMDCAEGVLVLSAIFDGEEDPAGLARATRMEFEQMARARGRLSLLDLDGLYEDTEASFIEAAERLGYDRHGNRTLGDVSMNDNVSPIALIKEHLDRADDGSQRVVFAAFKPIQTSTEPTRLLIVLDVDLADEENPIVVGQRGLAWGETAILLDGPKAKIPLAELMGHKTDFDYERVNFGFQAYGGAAMTVPGLAARIAEASTGTLDNAPAYKHMAGRYFSELRNAASAIAHEEGLELSVLDPEAFGDRILAAHAQIDLAKDSLINDGPGFDR